MASLQSVERLICYGALALVSLLVPYGQSFAQTANGRLDSLTRMLEQVETVEGKVAILRSMADASQADSAIRYSKDALSLAKRTDNTSLIGQSLFHLGSLLVRTSHYDDAEKILNLAAASGIAAKNNALLADVYLELSIVFVRLQRLDSARAVLNKSLSLELGSDKNEKNGLAYNMLGNVAKEENKFEDALTHYIRATDIFEGDDNLKGLTQSLANIGNIQYLLGDYDKALKYALQSLDIAVRLKKQSSIAYANRLLGRIYRRQKKFDQALVNYKKALAIYQAKGERREAGETFTNIGNIFFELEKYRDALNYYSGALRIKRAIGDSVGMAYDYNAKAITYLSLGNPTTSIAYFDSAMIFAERKKLHLLVMDGYLNKSDLYRGQKNYQLAYENYLGYADLKDSLAELRNKEASDELETRYQSEKKENEINTLHAENQIKTLQLEKERTQQLYLIGVAILSLLLIGVLYNRYRIKQKTAEKLGQLDAAKSRFFANISHEFRTPLTLILSPLQRALTQPSEGLSNQDLHIMHRNASRLHLLINQVLELSRIESGKLKLQVCEVDIRRMVVTTCSAFQSQAEQRKINYTIQVQDGIGTGLIDHDKIETILVNLISNAFKFTQDEGTISINVSREGNLTIRVRDSGIGIAARYLNSVFDRFYQIDDSSTRAIEGTGIGLALAKELADFHHGKLTVSSEEGKGSEFVLEFPVDRNFYKTEDVVQEQQIEDRYPVVKELLPAGHTEDGTNNAEDSFPLILVAEDNVDMRAFICKVLKDQYRIEEATDGEDAWKRATVSVPDLVITDVMMPRMDGTMLCDKLKRGLATNHIPVVMLTARAGQQSKLDGLVHGADDYLVKPFDTRELQIRIHNLLEQRRKLRDRYRQEITLQPANIEVTPTEVTFLQEIHAILERKFSDPAFGVEELNLEIGLSRMQLHRKLKALTDQSSGEFIRNFRLEKAKQYLRIKDSQVSQVAYDCGFNNVSHFGKTFREHTGMTPSEYIATSLPVTSS